MTKIVLMMYKLKRFETGNPQMSIDEENQSILEL